MTYAMGQLNDHRPSPARNPVNRVGGEGSAALGRKDEARVAGHGTPHNGRTRIWQKLLHPYGGSPAPNRL
jgi:hypothetical protein